MRPTNGSMMDPAGGRPGDLPRAQQRLLQASLPDAQHPSRTPIPLLPVARAMAWQSAAQTAAGNQASQAAQTIAALPLLAFDGLGTAGEGLALAGAVAQQWLALQAQWLDGLTELGQEMGEIRQANTVAKFVDQEMNLVQQGLALLTAQATATARLAENIQVNVAWWLHQRATAAARPQ